MSHGVSHEPGADELRVRSILKSRGIGPDAEPDRWDQQPEPGDGEEPPASRPFEPQPGYWPQPHLPAPVSRARDRAEIVLSPRTRRALYNATAAGAGWALGLYWPFATAIADCGQHYSISGGIVLGAGGSLLIAHVWDRRTRHWWPPLAWCARIPLATAVAALALWAPGA